MRPIVLQDAIRMADYPLAWDILDNKMVFITGATGFIGSHLISAIMMHNRRYGTNIQVLALVRSVENAQKIFADFSEDKNLIFLAGNVLHPIETGTPVDYVIHCASNAAPDQYASDPVGTMMINFDGTMNTLNFAKSKNVFKYIYVSTIEVYGRTERLETIGEEDFGFISSTTIRSCYPESKKCAENLAICYGYQYDLNVSIARLSYVYGADSSFKDSKVCSLFARKVANGEDIVMNSPGTQLRSYTYVTDIITGLLTVLTKGESGTAYNIASSHSRISIADMARKMCDLFPEKNSTLKFDLPSEAQKQSFSFIADAVLNSDRIEGLGWGAEVSLDDGIHNTIQDYIDRQDN